jgi:DNA-directed RNA polymerase subunit RPC12/RpoP
MAYHCNDCSYRGVNSGAAGECPACGSYALVRKIKMTEEPPPPKWRLVLLVVLWTYLIGHILWKLFLDQ